MKTKELYIGIKQNAAPDATDLNEVYALIERTAGRVYRESVELSLCGGDGFDFYEVSDGDGKIKIRSCSGVGLAAGFNAYLKECCGYAVGALSVSGALPKTPPKVEKTVFRKSRFLYRYFFNYCTFSYTYAFDTWEDWERTLDYLILSGYNLILCPVGTESVWRNTLLSLGYGKEEIDGFLCGPAFYAFEWMMNLTGWAGGAPEHWYEQRRELAGKINARLHSFGIMTAAPGYAGMVPNDFSKRFPDSKPQRQGKWCGFDRPDILLPGDPYFDRVADIYYEESKKIAGADHTHFYSVDPFHEGGVSTGVDLARFGKSVYEKMEAVDQNAVWLLQGWGNNPDPKMLADIQDGRALIVNLLSETNSGSGLYGGNPWCFCAVCCFGGQYNFQGNAEEMLAGPHRCMDDEKTNIIGIGYMPEGVNCVEFIYEILACNAFSENGELDEFIKHYLTVRYGVYNEGLAAAWKSFCREVLNGTQKVSGESALSARPTLNTCRTSSWGYKPDPKVDQSVLIGFIETLLGSYGELGDNPAYRKDLTEAARQAISNLSWYFASSIQNAYAGKDLDGLSYYGKELLSLFDIQTAIVSTDPDMLLGKWLEKAKRHGRTPAERAYFEWNARVQITLWGDREGAASLRDYSAREWQGLLEDFYRPRWESFISRLEISLLTGKELAQINHYDEELPFVYRKKVYPTEPSGDLRGAVIAALDKIRSAK